MSTATSPPRSVGSGSAPAARPNFASLITGKGSGLPNRYVLHGREGWGKTSFGAQWPNPFVIQVENETGLDTLISAGRLAEVPHLPEAITEWSMLLDFLRWMREAKHEYKTLVLDALNGAERLCHSFVCARDFKNNWGDAGFQGYQRGAKISMADWRDLLVELDLLRSERKMGILLLCHTKVATFKNPSGPDFDRYQPDLDKETWSVTHKWADCVLFGNFETVVQGGEVGDKPKKGKAADTHFRMLYTEASPTFDAKNRLGLPAEIEMGNSPQEAWANFRAAVKSAREVANG